jgi:hypothetical protein
VSITQTLPDNMNVVAPFPASKAVARGNLLWWDSVNKIARSASERSDLGAVALNQIDFARLFLGVAADTRLVGETTQTGVTGNSDRNVVQSGIFDCSIVSATPNLGDLYGIDRDPVNNVNLNQQLVKVANPAMAIAICQKQYFAATTVVRLRITGNISFTDLEIPGSQAVGGLQGYGPTVLADAAIVLTVASNPLLSMVPTQARNVTLPLETQSQGLEFRFSNESAGANAVTFLGSAGGAIKGNGVVPQSKTGIFWCDGSRWMGIVSA